MRSIGEFIEHPQLAARDRWREVGSEAGPLHALLPPVAMENAEPVMARIPGVASTPTRYWGSSAKTKRL
jgi:crotonobetainyl-CoA:carnitine CoA-transferase CaiB-like acyl-CoA transferase